MNRRRTSLVRRNLRLARVKYGQALNRLCLSSLRVLTLEFGFSMEAGEILLLDGSWYVTHSGLLRVAIRKGCLGIQVVPALRFCAPEQSRWAFRATAFKNSSCKGFNGYGDANPENVSPLVRGAEMRVAETRAVNRALRKAYGIGICSVEEIGTLPPSPEPTAPAKKIPRTVPTNEHPLRDRLLVLVRQHRLDVRLVKLYAAEFCEVKEVRDANRERMREFIEHLSVQATTDCEALQQKLATYDKRTEGVA